MKEYPELDNLSPCLNFWEKNTLMMFSFNTLYYSMSFTFVKLSIKLRLSRRLRSSCDRTQLRKTVYSFSILTPTDSSSPSSTTSRGSGSSPRSPTPTHSPSTTSTGRRRSRTGQYINLYITYLCHAFVNAILS